MHSAKSGDDAQETRSGLPFLGSEKGRRIALRQARIIRQCQMLNHAIEDCLDDLAVARKALIGVQSLALEVQKSAGDIEEPFGGEWP